MVRLMGLPPAHRFPKATLSRHEELYRLRFDGATETRVVEIPHWTLAGQDLEAAELGLLAQLQRLGYDVTLARDQD